MTRETDVAQAVSLGSAYVGVIFAESPRRLEPANARVVLAPARGRAKVAGVFGPASVETIAPIAAEVALDVVQLHGDPSPALIDQMRLVFNGEIWAVIRIAGSDVPAEAAALIAA